MSAPRNITPPWLEPRATIEPEWTWYVVRDVPELGGDGTFYTGVLADLWNADPRKAAVLTRAGAERAIEDCDACHVLRHRLRALPAWQFGCVPGGRP